MDFHDVQNGCQGDIDAATMQRGSSKLHITTRSGEYLLIDVPTVLHLASNLDIVHFAKNSANVPIRLLSKQGRYMSVSESAIDDSQTVFIANNTSFYSAYDAAKAVQSQRKKKKRKYIQELDDGDPLPNVSAKSNVNDESAKSNVNDEDIDCLIIGELTREQKDEVGRANAIEL